MIKHICYIFLFAKIFSNFLLDFAVSSPGTVTSCNYYYYYYYYYLDYFCEQLLGMNALIFCSFTSLINETCNFETILKVTFLRIICSFFVFISLSFLPIRAQISLSCFLFFLHVINLCQRICLFYDHTTMLQLL